MANPRLSRTIYVLTRDNQRTDELYRVTNEKTGEEIFFVTPDGEGRFYYETQEEAEENHGDDLILVDVHEVSDF